jgi:hypothetical protein
VHDHVYRILRLKIADPVNNASISYTCGNEADIKLILSKCKDSGVNAKTLSNFRSALRKYAQMDATLRKGAKPGPKQGFIVKTIIGTERLDDYEAHLAEKPNGDFAIVLNSLSELKTIILTLGQHKLAAEEFWVNFRKCVQSISA